MLPEQDHETLPDFQRRYEALARHDLDQTGRIISVLRSLGVRERESPNRTGPISWEWLGTLLKGRPPRSSRQSVCGTLWPEKALQRQGRGREEDSRGFEGQDGHLHPPRPVHLAHLPGVHRRAGEALPVHRECGLEGGKEVLSLFWPLGTEEGTGVITSVQRAEWAKVASLSASHRSPGGRKDSQRL